MKNSQQSQKKHFIIILIKNKKMFNTLFINNNFYIFVYLYNYGIKNKK